MRVRIYVRKDEQGEIGITYFGRPSRTLRQEMIEHRAADESLPKTVRCGQWYTVTDRLDGQDFQMAVGRKGCEPKGVAA